MALGREQELARLRQSKEEDDRNSRVAAFQWCLLNTSLECGHLPFAAVVLQMNHFQLSSCLSRLLSF